MLYRRQFSAPPYHDVMRTSQSQYIQDLQHTTDGSSIRSSDDGSSPGGEETERNKLEAKIEAAKEKLKVINLQREGDVEEFLSLSKEAEQQRGADNPQMARIRQHFEKKNKRHSHDTDHLQKKLAAYEQKLAEIENGTGLDTSRSNVISTVGQGIKRTGANLKGMTESVIAAPIELARQVRSAFGSSDNINVMLNGADDSRIGHSTFYSTNNSEQGSVTGGTPSSAAVVKGHQKSKSSTLPGTFKMELEEPLMTSTPKRYSVAGHESSYASLDNVEVIPHVNQELLEEIRNLHGQMKKMEERCEKLTATFQSELADLNRTLDEERFKYKKLEEMMNETIELHQAEFLSLKQEQKNIANRTDYQYQDRFRQVEENMEAVQNQMCRMENSIHHTLDMRLGGPGWGNQALLSGANILVELLKIFLFLVATVLDFFRPFTGSRTKAGALLGVLLLIFLFYQNVDVLSLFRRTRANSTVTAAEL